MLEEAGKEGLEQRVEDDLSAATYEHLAYLDTHFLRSHNRHTQSGVEPSIKQERI